MADKTPKSKANKTKTGTGGLVVVESPAKARTVGRILGKSYRIAASLGHVRDLPKGKLGIDVEGGFVPSYVVMKARAPVVQELKKLGQASQTIYLATDPDREGEAISWHLVKAAGWDQDSKDLKRVVFHEITERGIKEAFAHPRTLDMDLVGAQQARRILDRLVGYQLSPLLWKKVQRGLSAGRVQSVALRLVVDREREIEGFVRKEYWTIEATLEKGSDAFTAVLHALKGARRKLEILNEEHARKIEEDLQGAAYQVSAVKTEEKKRGPSAPFTTSTLQQEAWRKLRLSPKRTMALAQQLYEGLPIDGGESVGLITYMRTDSTNVASSAVHEARDYIAKRFGPEYLPVHPRAFHKKAKAAQEAHEAIRPTSVQRTPEGLKAYLSPEHLKLYDLIWRRMLASQMADARYDATSVEVDARSARSGQVHLFRASGSVPTFLGFCVLYMESQDERGDGEGDGALPALAVGDKLRCRQLLPKQHFTQPPPRYTEASLVKALEQDGIGRPSTYAPILSTIMDRSYVVKEQGRLKPTILGTQVCDLLTQFFPDIMDVAFTARMEDGLDEVARGERQWVPMLQDFYTPFQKTLEMAAERMPRVKVEEPTNEVCEKCGSPMLIKIGRFGRFMACSGFPNCRNTKPILNRIGVQCPKCGGDLVQRQAKGKRRVFYGCASYPACDFSLAQRPLKEPCPECGGLMVGRGRTQVRCTVCAWQGSPTEQEPAASEA